MGSRPVPCVGLSVLSLNARFPRSNRLLHAPDYARVFAQPNKTSDDCFTVLARTTASAATPARLGLAISRKCARRAVDRNRIKRLIRESFRAVQQALQGGEFVVMCRPAAVARDNAHLRESLTSHWRRQRERLCANLPA